jgi:succinate dehydrogenase / fumarate reductase iron-sulfur subunit
MVEYEARDISPDMSFLEMLDVVNERLMERGEVPIAFDHDCREGICGSCSLMINGVAHGPERGTASCQLHMRRFKDGDTVTVEPWRARAFPILRDLVVDRGAFDRIIQAGGFISSPTGSADDARSTRRWMRRSALPAARVSLRVPTALPRSLRHRKSAISGSCRRDSLNVTGGL